MSSIVCEARLKKSKNSHDTVMNEDAKELESKLTVDQVFFTITAEILAHSLANFHCQ